MNYDVKSISSGTTTINNSLYNRIKKQVLIEKSLIKSLSINEDFNPFNDEHVRLLDNTITRFFYAVDSTDNNDIDTKHDLFLLLAKCGEHFVSSLKQIDFDMLLLKYDINSINLIPYVLPEHNKLLQHLIISAKHLGDTENTAQLLKEFKHCIPFWSNNTTFRERLEFILHSFPEFKSEFPFDNFLINSMQNFKPNAIKVFGDYIDAETAINCSFPDYLFITNSTSISDVIACIDSIIALKLLHVENVNPSHFASVFNACSSRNEDEINALLNHKLMSSDLLNCMNDTANAVFLSHSLLKSMPEHDLNFCCDNQTCLADADETREFTL